MLKTLHTTHGGKLSIARVLAGSVGDGAELIGPDGPVGRVSGVFRIMGQQATKRDAAQAGETVGLGKLDGARTGMTLGAGKARAGADRRRSPRPIRCSAPRSSSAERKDDVKLSSALAKALEEDPSLRVTHVQDTGETLVEGQGEMHLRVALERLTGKYGIAVKTHEPAIPYKETIRGAVSVRGRHKKQSGGHGQFGDVVLDIKPLPRGSGFRVRRNDHRRRRAAELHSRRSRRASREYLAKGPLGFQVVDIAVTLTDGSYHAVDSSDMAFRTAAQIGMREGMPQCRPVLLEPVLKVEIAVPVRRDAAGQRHRLAAPRPAPRLRRAAGLEGLGRGRGADPAGRDPRPHHRAALGDRRRRHLPEPLRPSRRTDRQARRPGDRAGRRAGGVRRVAGAPAVAAPRQRDLIVLARRPSSSPRRSSRETSHAHQAQEADGKSRSAWRRRRRSTSTAAQILGGERPRRSPAALARRGARGLAARDRPDRADLYPAPRNSKYTIDRPVTPEADQHQLQQLLRIRHPQEHRRRGRERCRSGRGRSGSTGWSRRNSPSASTT